jgi:hypothetical protein
VKTPSLPVAQSLPIAQSLPAAQSLPIAQSLPLVPGENITGPSEFRMQAQLTDRAIDPSAPSLQQQIAQSMTQAFQMTPQATVASIRGRVGTNFTDRNIGTVVDVAPGENPIITTGITSLGA